MKRNLFLIIGMLILLLIFNCNATSNALPNIPDAPVQYSPSNGAKNISLSPNFSFSSGVASILNRLQISTNPSFTTTVVDDTTPIGSITLNAGTTYYWRVNAKNTGGTSAWSSTFSFTTIIASPTLITPANAATGVTTLPTLTWGTVTGATNYRVQVSTKSTFTTTVMDDSTLSTETQTLTTSLENNSIYYWRVNARNYEETSTWSTIMSFIIQSPPNMTDIDGNVYHTVKIGTQIWTVENLKVTKYKDGNAIPLITDNTSWAALTTPGYCWYDNDAATNKDIYGALYNWYAVNTGRLAPAGWHVPSYTEWNTLQNYLIANGYNFDGTTIDNKIAKSMASQSDWCLFSGAGSIGNDLSKNNKSGFSALPGGGRGSYGFFQILNTLYSYWWCSTENYGVYAYYRYLSYASNNLNSSYSNKSYGCSVRLVKD